MVEAGDGGRGNGDSVLDAVSKDGSGSSGLLRGREAGGFEGIGSMAFRNARRRESVSKRCPPFHRGVLFFTPAVGEAVVNPTALGGH
jgi:hypothetical protein